MTSIVALPYEYFGDPAQSRAISSGQIYVGIAGTLPADIPTNQKLVTARQEDGTEVPIAQPIETDAGGYPQLNGSTVQLLVAGSYSLLVLDALGAQKFYSTDVTKGIPITTVTGVIAVPLTTDILTGDYTSTIRIETQAYSVANDGGGGTWIPTGVVTPGSSGTTDFSNGVLYDSAGNQFKYGHNVLDPSKFGVRIDDATDDYAAMQAVINYAETSDLAIRSKEGNMLLSAGLVATKGIDWEGLGGGTVGTGSFTEVRGTVLKSTTAAITLLTLKGAVAGDIVKNAKLNNISFDGNFLAFRGLLASTVYYSTFKNLVAKAMAGAQYAFELNDGNGNISLLNEFDNCHYNGTANPESASTGAFAFRSTNASGGGCVQNKVRNCSDLVQNGRGLFINGSDNNVIESYQSFVTGTGTGIRLGGGGVGSVYARNNQFIVPVAGSFVVETGTYGNEIITSTSEAFNLTAQANSQVHYSVFDYVESSKYTTHHYDVTDYHEVTPGDSQVSGAATRSAALGLWDSIQLPESAEGGMLFNMPIKYGWKNGKVKAVEISFISDAANVSANAQFRLRAEVLKDNSTASTPDLDRTFVQGVNDAANALTVVTEQLGLAAVSLGTGTNWGLALRIDRNPGAANDTCTSNLYVTSVRLFFQFDGPINGQTVSVTAPYKDF